MARKTNKAPVGGSDKALTVAPDKNMTAPQKRGVPRGLDTIDPKEDIKPPRILLLQPLSPQVTEGVEKPGTFFINKVDKSLGAKIKFVAIMHFRSRIKWIPQDEGGGQDCSSADAKTPSSGKRHCKDCATCQYSQWNDAAKTPKDKAPKCTMYENFVGLVNDETMPVVLAMGKTATKPGKQLVERMFYRGEDIWNFQYEFDTKQDQNEAKQKYWTYVLGKDSVKTVEAVRATCEKLYTLFNKATIVVEMEPETGDGASVTPVAAGADKY